MSWRNLLELVEDFGLIANPSDAVAIQKEVREKYLKIHPDRTKGEFPDESTEARFHRLAQALEWLNGYQAQETALVSQGAALLSTEHLPALAESLKSLDRLSHEERVRSLADAARLNSREARRVAYSLPRIGSGSLAAIAAFLVAAPDNFVRKLLTINSNSTHEVEYLAHKEAMLTSVSLLVAVLAWVLFCFTWMMERREQEQVEDAMSASVGAEFLKELLGNLQGEADDRGVIRFTTGQFTEVVDLYLDRNRFLLRLPDLEPVLKSLRSREGDVSSMKILIWAYFSPLIMLLMPLEYVALLLRGRRSAVVAEKIAALHLKIFEGRGVIFSVRQNNIVQMYEVASDVGLK